MIIMDEVLAWNYCRYGLVRQVRKLDIRPKDAELLIYACNSLKRWMSFAFTPFDRKELTALFCLSSFLVG